MGSVSERLRAVATVRTKTVEIDGEAFIVREVGAASFAEYGKMVGDDQRASTAILLSECVVNEDGSPALTREDAIAIAGSARVTMPLVRAIMDVSGFGEKEPHAN